MPRVLLVDDDPNFTFAISSLLERQGHAVSIADRGGAALDEARGSCFDVAFLDLTLPDADGLVLLDAMAGADPLLPIICLTGRDDTGSVVQAMRKGAIDYLTKPVDKQTLFNAVTSASQYSAARRSGTQIGTPAGVALPVGGSPEWRRAVELISAAAAAPKTTVLITGEPGTGKEVMASLLHRMSARRDAPMVTANAACFTPSLMESELFGHEAGAFTGAKGKHRGLFEQADHGVLFLDEIGELALDLQGKLLRILEGHPFRRVGGSTPVETDVRLVAATNRDLPELVKKGQFRADLLERLKVFEVPLPPLRSRRPDIERLVHHFIARLGPEMGITAPSVTAEALQMLREHSWPGNVRELRNVIERALVLAAGPINPRHLPIELTESRGLPHPPLQESDDVTLEEVIRRHIIAVFNATDGNVTRTADRLGMSRLALRKRLQAYGLRPVGS
ncbi:MAG: sigma-54 dependent transcriptional regulator [Archangium sp.]